MSFLRTIGLTLNERLAHHIGYEVAIQAPGFASVPGVLLKVGKRFMRVNHQYYVPHTLQEIVLLHTPHRAAGEFASIRTVYAGTFRAKLLYTGLDYVELLVTREEEEEDLWMLIPFGQIISVERIP